VSVIDDVTRFATIMAIHKKSDVEAMLHNYLAMVPLGLKCCWLCSNQGSKYTGKQVQELLCSASIVHEATLVHTPEHNGVAKHFNWTIVEMVWCMLHNSGIAKSYWGKTLCMATAIYNWLPTNANNGVSPLDWWDPDNTCTLQDVHQFGDKVEVLVLPGECSKLSAHMWTGTYLGPVGSGVSNHHVLVQG
jgi:hypothetical protein